MGVRARELIWYVAANREKLGADGERTNFALGVIRLRNDNYVSVMLLAGKILAEGFSGLKQAHKFNDRVALSLPVGVIKVEDFFAQIAKDDAVKLIAKIRKEVGAT